MSNGYNKNETQCDVCQNWFPVMELNTGGMVSVFIGESGERRDICSGCLDKIMTKWFSSAEGIMTIAKNGGL